MNNNDVAKKIIKENIYLSIATMDLTPWIASMRYRVDDEYTFYFASKRDAKHVDHILKNSVSACAIFDSHQADGTGQGIQMEGNAFIMEGEELKESIKKFWPNKTEQMFSNFSQNSKYRLLKFVPTHIFILDPTDIAEDRRVEVQI